MNDTDPRRSDHPSPARTRGEAVEFRPTLFGEDEPAATGTDGLRILGSLQPLPPPRLRRNRGRWILGGLMLATLVASTWLGVRYAAQAADGRPETVDTDLATRHPASAGPAAPQPAAPASAILPAPAASVGQLEAPPAAARIEADTPPAARDPFAGLEQAQAPTPTPPQAPAVATATADAASAADASPAPVPVPAARRTQPVVAPPARVARAEPRSQPAVRPAQPAPAPAAQPGRRPGDEDVELIEAVVSHGAGRKRAPQPVARASAARGSARDVVQRQAPADSTAELLQRCDAVGGLEGVLCRWRICADRWGQDPACPKSTQRPYREPS